MSLGPLMVDLQGLELDAEDREVLSHPLVGGVILFGRNYQSPEQLTALTGSIHALRSPKLLVAVDHEGGRVQRFRDGFTRLPAVAHLGAVYDRDPRQARHLAELSGWLMAAELRAVGVDVSFAPVLDLGQGVSKVIGDRALHRDPEIVAELAHAYTGGMQAAGMSAVGKHFPGHGGVEADTHTDRAVDTRDLNDLRDADLVPFERMIHFGLPAIMSAHVVYPSVDAAPASRSSFWLKRILRGELEFQGAIFSDDLSMAGAGEDTTLVERARSALVAGSDMVLVCNDRDGCGRVLDGLDTRVEPAAAIRLARMHGRNETEYAALRRSPRWKDAVRAVEGYGLSETLELDM